MSKINKYRLIPILFLSSGLLHAQTAQTITGNTNNVSAQASSATVLGDHNQVDGSNDVVVSGSNNALSASPNAVQVGTQNTMTFSGTMPPGVTPLSGPGGDNVQVGSSASLNGLSSVQVGANATSTGQNNTSIGSYSQVYANSATCLGSGTQCGSSQASSAISTSSVGAQTAVGTNASAIASFTTSVGAMTSAQGQYSVVLGYGASDAGYTNCIAVESTCDRDNAASFGNRQLTQIGYGTQQYDALAVGQVVPLAKALGGGSTFTNGSFLAPNYTLSGSTFSDVGSALDYLDHRITTVASTVPTTPSSPNDPNAIHYDTGSNASSATLQGQSGTQIHNLAPGTASSDAATLGQVQSGDAATLTSAKNYTNQKTARMVQYDDASQSSITLNNTQIHGVQAGTATTDAANVGQVSSALTQAQSYTDASSANVQDWAKNYTDRAFNRASKQSASAGAVGTAIGMLALGAQGISYSDKLIMSVANYRGQMAMGFGYNHSFGDGKMSVAVGGAIARGGPAFGVSFGIGLHH